MNSRFTISGLRAWVEQASSVSCPASAPDTSLASDSITTYGLIFQTSFFNFKDGGCGKAQPQRVEAGDKIAHVTLAKFMNNNSRKLTVVVPETYAAAGLRHSRRPYPSVFHLCCEADVRLCG